VPTHYDITISVDTDGHFTYKPTDLRASPHDTVSFKTEPANQAFEVMFKHRSPGDRTHISHKTPQDRGSVSGVKQGHLECGVVPGHYKYAAAIYDGSNVFLDSGCGSIGVGN